MLLRAAPSSATTIPASPPALLFFQEDSMNRSSIARATATALAAACVMVVGSRVDISGEQDRDRHPDGAGIHWARQHQPIQLRSRRSPDLSYHGGPVMHGTHV